MANKKMTNNSKVKAMGGVQVLSHILGPTSYRLTSFGSMSTHPLIPMIEIF